MGESSELIAPIKELVRGDATEEVIAFSNELEELNKIFEGFQETAGVRCSWRSACLEYMNRLTVLLEKYPELEMQDGTETLLRSTRSRREQGNIWVVKNVAKKRERTNSSCAEEDMFDNFTSLGEKPPEMILHAALEKCDAEVGGDRRKRHRIESKEGSPSVESKEDSPDVESKEDSLNVESKEDSPNVESKEDSLNVESKEDSPNVESKANSPNVESKANSPNVESKEGSPNVESKEGSPNVEPCREQADAPAGQTECTEASELREQPGGVGNDMLNTVEVGSTKEPEVRDGNEVDAVVKAPVRATYFPGGQEVLRTDGGNLQVDRQKSALKKILYTSWNWTRSFWS